MTNYFEIITNGKVNTFTKLTDAKTWLASCPKGTILWQDINGTMEQVAQK